MEDWNQGPPNFKSSPLNHSATLPLISKHNTVKMSADCSLHFTLGCRDSHLKRMGVPIILRHIISLYIFYYHKSSCCGLIEAEHPKTTLVMASIASHWEISLAYYPQSAIHSPQSVCYSRSSRKRTPLGGDKNVRNWSWPLMTMVLVSCH